MEKHTKKALSATKNLHKRLREWEEHQNCMDHTHVDYAELKTLAADANKAIQAMQRHASDEAVVDVRRREEDGDDAGRRARGVRVETGREVSVR